MKLNCKAQFGGKNDCLGDALEEGTTMVKKIKKLGKTELKNLQISGNSKNLPSKF